jgi:glycosyltransferase involved in cell wall biosynthesis
MCYFAGKWRRREMSRREGNYLVLSRIAVLIPSYNSAKYIIDALESIPCEIPSNILISDDGSSDGTVKAIQQYSREKQQDIELAVHKVNQGLNLNLKYLFDISSMKYKFILILPPDDFLHFWDPRKLMRKLERNNSINLVNNILVFVDEKSTPTGQVYIPPQLSLFGNLALAFALVQNTYTSPGSIIRTGKANFDYLQHDTKFTQDWTIALHLILNGKMNVNKFGFIFYRQHSASISSEASYISTHVEWHRYLLVFINSVEFTKFLNLRSRMWKRMFFKLYDFLSSEYPNCVHQICTKEALREKLGIRKCARKERQKLDCLRLAKLDRFDDKRKRLDKWISKLLKIENQHIVAALVSLKTFGFLAKRVYFVVKQKRLESKSSVNEN